MLAEDNTKRLHLWSYYCYLNKLIKPHLSVVFERSNQIILLSKCPFVHITNTCSVHSVDKRKKRHAWIHLINLLFSLHSFVITVSIRTCVMRQSLAHYLHVKCDRLQSHIKPREDAHAAQSCRHGRISAVKNMYGSLSTTKQTFSLTFHFVLQFTST